MQVTPPYIPFSYTFIEFAESLRLVYKAVPNSEQIEPGFRNIKVKENQTFFESSKENI